MPCNPMSEFSKHYLSVSICFSYLIYISIILGKISSGFLFFFKKWFLIILKIFLLYDKIFVKINSEFIKVIRFLNFEQIINKLNQIPVILSTNLILPHYFEMIILFIRTKNCILFTKWNFR